MTLPSGKILSAEVRYNAENDTWVGNIIFDPKLMPMDLDDGLSAIAALIELAKTTAGGMIQQGEELADLGITEREQMVPKGQGGGN